MNSTERLRQAKYLERDKAFALAADLQDAGLKSVFVQSQHQGWTVNPGGHADMLAAAKVCERHGCGILYRPFGGEGWPDVMLYALEATDA
ncbi:MAG TPA: hypothetical protein VI039_13010 [Solirubrobacterales bacterium]